MIERYPDMRKWVAHDKKVPLSILRILATDADERVRWMVACKGKLDEGLFATLARDKDAGVRARLAHHRKAPEAIIDQLLNDSEELVARAARENWERRQS